MLWTNLNTIFIIFKVYTWKYVRILRTSARTNTRKMWRKENNEKEEGREWGDKEEKEERGTATARGKRDTNWKNQRQVIQMFTSLFFPFSFMLGATPRRPFFCGNSSDSIPSFPSEQCSDSGGLLSPNEVVEGVGDGASGSYYVTLKNVGMWHQVLYKFRIPKDVEEEVSN